MNQESKQLLLQDLCARLPYGVKVEHLLHAPINPSDLFAIDIDKQLLYCDHKGREEWYNVEFVKPYLRPMSSMTEEEKEKQKSFIYHFAGNNLPNYEGNFVFEDEAGEYIDWLNKNMFDYRGLIPKGLAIEVTAENNPYKK